MEQQKPHLSATQIETYTTCGERYRRRYIEGEIIPPGVALLKGKGFHSGAETNMRQKIETHEDLPTTDIVDAAVASFEAETHGGYSLTEDEQGIGKDIVLGAAKDNLAAMALAHARYQAPEYQPELVEEKIRIGLPGEYDLLGIIDLADDQRRIIDFKTAGKKKSQGDADSSVQLTIYAASYRAHTGYEPEGIRLDTIVQTKAGKIDRQPLDTERDLNDLNALANRINRVADGIQAGIFIPASPGNWACSPKFCGFWSTCSLINHERKAAAEASE